MLLTSGTTSASTPPAALQTLALASPNTFGAQSTLVLLVNFSDNTSQPTTVDAAQNLVFNTVSNFDKENSQNQTWLTGNVYGWFTLPMTSTACDTNTLATQAKQAATNAGINLSAYKRYVYMFPTISACSWSGMGTIGGSPSQAWINGYVTSLQVVGHEMGHNFGLYHAHSLNCSGSTLGTNCSTVEYGDMFDIMGQYTASHFDAFHKEQLGWLNYGASLPITTVSGSGTYTLPPYETNSGSKALKILKSTDSSTGASTWYYVEYRQPTGFDSSLTSYPASTTGLLIRTGSSSDGNSSYLLDQTPQTTTFKDAALPVGATFTDPASGVTINLVSANASGATVNVTLGTSSCSHNNPSVSLTPAQASGNAGATANYTVSVRNNDSSICNTSSFNLAASLPSGWSSSFGSSMLAMAPGASGSTTLQVTSPSTATAALYNFGVSATNATDSSFLGSATGSYTVNSTSTAPAGITVVSPASGATVNSPVQFSASAVSSNSAYPITAMRIYVDNTSMYTVNAASLSTSLPLAAGSHNVVFVAWDASGQAYTKALPITVAGTISAGGVTIVSPRSGSYVTSPVRFVASATASTGKVITAMRIYVDNISAYTVSGASLNTSLTLLRGGHYVVIQAWDNTGGVYRSAMSLTVN
jgi:hypothetical protein